MPVTTSPAAGKEASVLVKGVSRRVIVVESPDPRIFEQAIFILPTDGGGVSSRQLVDQAVRIARKTLSIVRQNIVFALAVKGLVLVLSALGYVGMWWAVFADVGVSVLAILNASRMLRAK